MTLHLSARQWGNAGPQGAPKRSAGPWGCPTCARTNPEGVAVCQHVGCPGKRPGVATGHRTDGYRSSKKRWVCLYCRAFHDAKPKACIAPDCESSTFLFFDSKGEALRFMQLWNDQDHGQIQQGTLRHHPRFDLCAPSPTGGAPICVAFYEADSAYVLHTGESVVEDFKPKNAEALDPVFRLKRRWFEAQYAPQRITLVST